eukprot:jgi/Orpsp1_1/1180912/evm.model.c7180000075104.1
MNVGYIPVNINDNYYFNNNIRSNIVNTKFFRSSRYKLNRIIYISLATIFFILLICILGVIYLTSDIIIEYKNTIFNNILNEVKPLIFNSYDNDTIHDAIIGGKELLPDLEGFTFLDTDSTEGPITVDKDNDDGTKLNIYSMMMDPTNSSIYYEDIEKYNEMEDILLPIRTKYLCELESDILPEGHKGYSLFCPPHYTIAINSTFYGRFALDNRHCNRYSNGDIVPTSLLIRIRDFGVDLIDEVKSLCEGRKECVLKPYKYFFHNVYPRLHKYLYVSYYCRKEKNYEKPKFAITTFINKIEVNSVYENSINQFYQYAKIHGYEFQLRKENYDNERVIFYMKINTVIESMIKGLNEKSYDWILWVDGDTVLTNPNIELEAFIPENNNIHFVAADDYNGLNAGVFLIRVHSWSLNFLMTTSSYAYYHSKKILKYSDQSSLNNALVEQKEDEHYVIVPQNWFNSYLDNFNKGDFLVHLPGISNKDEEAKKLRSQILEDEAFYRNKTSQQMREEVLAYYKLPREEQHHISEEE